MSAGRFGWTRAGFIGPLTISPSKPFGPLSGPPEAGKISGDEIARHALTLAATQGHFNFRAFDTNHDGKISESELDILVMVSGSNTSGHAGSFGAGGVPIPGQNVTYMGRKAVAGEGGAFMGYAHELFHTIGAVDLYGPWHGCLTMNEGLSLMTSTNTAPQTEYSLAIDAWHKMWVGWTEPRLAAMGHPGNAELAAEHSTEAERKRPILIYDPRKGKSEFFLLEYRTPHPLGYDRNTVTSGLVIWHIAYRPDGKLLVRKSERPNCKGEYPNITAVFVRGAPDFQQGISKAYTSANGEIVLRWMDGKDSGMRVTVAPHKPTDLLLKVSWSTAASVKSRD
jgi:M6 family metalloprotease-like protein